MEIVTPTTFEWFHEQTYTIIQVILARETYPQDPSTYWFEHG
jgi:hypothetical protein